MTKIDWRAHVAAFRASGESVAAYCRTAGIKAATFRYHLSKDEPERRRQKRGFVEFEVASELMIRRDPSGTLTLSGFDLSHLPQIVAAWSHALSCPCEIAGIPPASEL